ncbi:hypothetical protein LPA46_06505 [Halobacterium sp. KA-6]|nr:hypothetical protein [Halobacterium sp. KA-6]
MQRRKFIAGLGSLAAAGAAGIGTGAFNVARVDRGITVSTTGDASAYLALDASTSEYASGTSGGELSVTFDELGTESNYVFNDVFRIQNNGQDNIIIDLADSEDSISWDTDYPEAYWTDDELGTTQNVGGDGEFNSDRPILSPGDDVYVQFNFVGRDADTGGDETDPDPAPDIIGIYAEATDQSSNTTSSSSGSSESA